MLNDVEDEYETESFDQELAEQDIDGEDDE